MNISITPELEAFVSEKVKSGMYHSASEVFRDALRLLIERDELKKRKLETFKKEIQIGLDEIESGDTVSLEDIDQMLVQLKGKHGDYN